LFHRINRQRTWAVLDQKIFKVYEDLKIGYFSGGKMYKDIKVVACYHERGSAEPANRALKDFGEVFSKSGKFAYILLKISFWILRANYPES